MMTTWTTAPQRTVLVVASLASFAAFLDGSAVNVALPAISGELGGGGFHRNSGWWTRTS